MPYIVKFIDIDISIKKSATSKIFAFLTVLAIPLATAILRSLYF